MWQKAAKIFPCTVPLFCWADLGRSPSATVFRPISPTTVISETFPTDTGCSRLQVSYKYSLPAAGLQRYPRLSVSEILKAQRFLNQTLSPVWSTQECLTLHCSQCSLSDSNSESVGAEMKWVIVYYLNFCLYHKSFCSDHFIGILLSLLKCLIMTAHISFWWHKYVYLIR